MGYCDRNKLTIHKSLGTFCQVSVNMVKNNLPRLYHSQSLMKSIAFIKS